MFIGVGDERGHVTPKIREGNIFGRFLCKIRAFFAQKSCKLGNFVNFFSGKYNKHSGIVIIFRERIM